MMMRICLAQSVIAKNLLTTVGRYSPQQAVFGIQPGILPDSTTVPSNLEDADEGLFARQNHRLREIALTEMITVSARNRVERANNSKTRDVAVLHNYQQDDKVEYWREPPSKGMSGWRGPATVVKVDPNGDIHVKYQSLIHTCRQQDVRPALLYWGNAITTAYLIRGEDSSFDRLRKFVEAMSNKQHAPGLLQR